MTDKTYLKSTMLELSSAMLAYAEDAYVEYLRDSTRNYREPADYGQSSQELNAAELAEAFECPRHSHEHALAKLRQIDFRETSEVKEGAAVLLNGRWFVVAVATAPFCCGDTTYMGISTAAPVYQCLEGKRAGDSFTFKGQLMTIDAVT